MDETRLMHDLLRASDEKSLEPAVAAVRAEYGLSETAAYAMLVRAKLGILSQAPTERGDASPPIRLAS